MNKKLTDRNYFPDGRLRSEVTNVDGAPNGVTRHWHHNGVLAMEIPTKNGQVEGVARQWDRSGRLLGSYEIRDGNGIQMVWAENGQLISEVSLLDGKMTGRLRAWFEDGALAKEQYWVEGRAVSSREYMECCRANPRLPRYEGVIKTESAKKAQCKRKKRTGRKREGSSKEPRVSPSATQHAISPRVAALIANGVEARRWLTEGEQGTRFLGELSTSAASAELIEDIYSLGAEEVLVLGIDRYPGGEENSGKLLIRLPCDRQKRKRVFAWCREKAVEQGYDGEVDTGQRELFVMLD